MGSEENGSWEHRPGSIDLDKTQLGSATQGLCAVWHSASRCICTAKAIPKQMEMVCLCPSWNLRKPLTKQPNTAVRCLPGSCQPESFTVFCFLSQFYFLFYVHGYCAWVYVCAPFAWCLWGTRVGFGCPETAVTDCCELPCGLGAEQPLLLIVEASLQPRSHRL